MAYNELGYATLSVAEPRRGVSVGALFAEAKKRDGGQCAVGRARAKVPSVACQPQLVAVIQLLDINFMEV